MKQELEKSFASEIRERFNAFVTKGRAMRDDMVNHTNDCRAIGLLLKEWSNNQFTFDFYQKHEEVLVMEYKQAKAFISVANRMEEPAETIEDARMVWQLDFQAAGLLAVPESFAPQQSHYTAPAVKLMGKIRSVREVLSRWLEEKPADKWDDEERETVVGQLEPLVKFYEEIRQKNLGSS